LSHPLQTVQLTLTDTPAGLVNVRSTFEPRVGRGTSPAQALSMDMCRQATHAGHSVAHSEAHAPLLAFAKRLLDPEDLGHAVTPEVRDCARVALGRTQAEPATGSTERPALIYISGPMTDVPDHNRHAFNLAAQALRTAGWQVFNPAENGLPTEAPWAEHLRVDIKHLMDCTHVATLDGWQNSRGATLEVRVATQLGMQVSSLQHWLSQATAEARALEVAA